MKLTHLHYVETVLYSFPPANPIDGESSIDRKRAAYWKRLNADPCSRKDSPRSGMHLT